MPGKQNDEPVESHDRYVDRINSSVHIEVAGMDLDLMRQSARMQAANLLRQKPEHLWITSESAPRVTQTSRFEPEPRPTEMTVSYAFGVIPESARQQPEDEPEPEPAQEEPAPNVVPIKRKPSTRRKK